MSFFTTTEFCITCLIIAAAVVAYLCVPARRGAARELSLAGDLDDDGEPGAMPAIRVDCLSDGTVMLTRTGLDGLTDADAVSIAVTIIGFDITVEERVVQRRAYGGAGGWPVNRATFTFDMLGRERYHLRYTAPASQRAATLTVSNRPGFNATRKLLQ